MRVLAWHFLPDDGQLRYPLNHRLVKVKPRQTLKVTGRLEICRRGLHASRRLIDALEYAPGSLLERVELSGDMIKGHDKICARERTCLWLLDCTKLLHEFACRCAEDVLRMTGVSNEQCWNAIKAKRKWIDGIINDDELETVRNDMWDKTWSARRTVWYATWTEASKAAWWTVRFAAQVIELARLNRRLTAMVISAARRQGVLR